MKHPVTQVLPVLVPMCALVSVFVTGLPEAYAAPFEPNLSPPAWDGLGWGQCLERLGLGRLLGLEPPAGSSAATTPATVRWLGMAVLAFAAVVVLAVGRMRMATESKRLDVARKLAEQGIDPPASLLLGPARNDLRRGIVLMFAGAGLFVSGFVVGDRGLVAGALVPEFVGVGYLVSYWLAARQPKPRGDS